ncbi:MAG: GntR family transcriptional regulator [Acidobacteriota bacterium]
MSTFAKPSPGDVLRPKSLRDEIVHFLQHDIITGIFQPGQRIVERELINRFGVSSIPVREALQDLESRGLLVRRLNHGYSVVQLTYEDAIRICELRRLLEPKVVEWATARITPEGIEELERQLDEVEVAAREGDMAAFFHSDLAFHRMLWKASGNSYAAKALESSMGTLFASGLARSERDTKAGTAVAIDRLGEVEKHRRMTKAMQEGDAQRAALALLEIAAGFERHFQRADD